MSVDQLGLKRHLKWLGVEACKCDHAYKSLGRVDRIDMGKGWVRMNTDPTCPIHGRCPRCDEYPKRGTLKSHICKPSVHPRSSRDGESHG